MPSLDAGIQGLFRHVNRPAPQLSIEEIIDGIASFSHEFSGRVWLEILLIQDCNDRPHHLAKLIEQIKKIKPEKVQLSTVFRPSRSGDVNPIPRDKLFEISSMLPGPVEVVADFTRRESPAYRPSCQKEIEAMLRIRPATLEDLSTSLGTHPNETLKYLQELGGILPLKEINYQGKTYYTLTRGNHTQG
jgi:wyosine [tRNA(Phe)-imidazoG37] synthetase (radical SAM superfamily)